MKSVKVFRTTQIIRRCALSSAALLVTIVPAFGQTYEITPLVGGLFGGTVKIEQEGQPNFHAHFTDRLSYGVAAGVRFDADDCEKCNTIQFRWLRQQSHLTLDDQDAFVAPVTGTPSFYPLVTANDFLGDFSHEWPLKYHKYVAPFLTLTLGAAYLTTPQAGATRFEFGASTGVKVFPTQHFGMRFQVEYLGIVEDANAQRLTCFGGTCLVLVNGSVINQFMVSAGPAFRF
jgi:hypothetical protein